MNLSRRKVLAASAFAPALAAAPWLAGAGRAAAQNPLNTEGLQAGGEILLPRGETRLEAPLRFDGHRLNIRGEGPHASAIRFEPGQPSAAIELNTPGAAGQFQSSVTGVGFISGNSTDKVAIRLVNVGNVNLERIGIAAGLWAGAGSTGIRTEGRQFVRIRDCELACARPIVVAPNRRWPTIGADFFTFASCELITTDPRGCSIEVEDGVVFSNFAIRDTGMVGGTDSFRFVDRSSRAASFNLEFQNVRTEQGTDPNGWSFDIRSANQSIQSILFQNVRCDSARNGIRIRNGHRITLINTDIDQAGGRTALDIEFVPATVLTILGGFNQVGGNVRLTNARKVLGVDSVIESALGPVETWVYDPAGR